MPQIEIAALWQRLEHGTIDPFYLFFGPETYLTRQYTEALADRVLASAPRDFNFGRYTVTDSHGLDEALGTARTLPVLATHRVVVVQDLQELRKADWKPLESYVASPSESTVLIAASHDGESKKFPDVVWERAVSVSCAPLKGAGLRRWVAREVTAAGYRIGDDAMDGLLQGHDSDLRILQREIEKLCTHVGEPGEIELENVQAVGLVSRQHSLFALSDALADRQPGSALSEVDHLLNQGEPALVIFSMIVRHLRLLWTVRQLAAEGEDRYRIGKTLRLPPRVCRSLMEQSRGFTTGRLQELYGAALEADLTFKSTNKPPRAILEGLILQVCAGAQED